MEEKEANFKNKLQHLIITDEKYNEEIKKIHDKDLDDQDQISELEADALRNLKDRLREDMGLPPGSPERVKVIFENMLNDIKLTRVMIYRSILLQ